MFDRVQVLPPPCFTIGMVPGFLQTWRLAFRQNSFILDSSDQSILFLMVWESLGAFWQNESGLSSSFYWGVACVWPLYHKDMIGGALQRWVSFWKVLPFPQRKARALPEGPSGSWSLGGSSLGGSKLLPFRMMEATVFLRTFNAAEMFWYSSPDLYLDTILSRSSTAKSFNLIA